MTYSKKPLCTRTCLSCGKIIQTHRKAQKYCTQICRAAAAMKRYGRTSAFPDVTQGTVGAIQELRVSVDLLTRGFEVFRALSPSCSCDLLAQNAGKLYDIEVRTAYRGRTGKVCVRAERTAKYLAMAFKDKLVYEPELPL